MKGHYRLISGHDLSDTSEHDTRDSFSMIITSFHLVRITNKKALTLRQLSDFQYILNDRSVRVNSTALGPSSALTHRRGKSITLGVQQPVYLSQVAVSLYRVI